jgi:putative peptide zinc metalloprotease protein
MRSVSRGPASTRRLRSTAAVALLALLVLLNSCQQTASLSADLEATATPAAAGPTATPAPAEATATTEPALAPDAEQDGVEVVEHDLVPGQGPGNIVHLVNRVDGRLRVKGRVELNRIHGPRVTPVNRAVAFGSCTDCQTLAVALQLNLYRRGAPIAAPENLAAAVNFQCTRCVTVARALQYVIPVDDPTTTPPEARALIQALNRELVAIQSDRAVTLAEAEQRIDAVIARFVGFSEHLLQARDEAAEQTSPEATASPTAAPAASPTPAPTASPTPASSSTPGAGATPTGTPPP